jgi:hypothetical protein
MKDINTMDTRKKTKPQTIVNEPLRATEPQV